MNSSNREVDSERVNANHQWFMATVTKTTSCARRKNNLAYSLERQPFSVPSQPF